MMTRSQWSPDDDSSDYAELDRLSQVRYGEVPRIPSNIGPLLQRFSVAKTAKTTSDETVSSESTWVTWGVDQRNPAGNDHRPRGL